MIISALLLLLGSFSAGAFVCPDGGKWSTVVADMHDGDQKKLSLDGIILATMLVLERFGFVAPRLYGTYFLFRDSADYYTLQQQRNVDH